MEKKKHFLINLCFYGVIFTAIYIFLKYAINYLIPFIIGLVIALMTISLNKKFLKDKSYGKYVCLVIVYLIIFTVVGLLGILLYERLGVAFNDLPGFISGQVKQSFENIKVFLSQIRETVPEAFKSVVDSTIESSINALLEFAKNLGKSLLGKVPGLVTMIPSTIVSTILVILSSFYFVKDNKLILEKVDSFLPSKLLHFINEIKIYLNGTLFKVIKSYMKILTITFVELTIGFCILKYGDYSFYKIVFISLLIACLDILPILGIGTVLLPWSAIYFISGDITNGIGFLLFYVILTVIRQIIEPRIVGTDLGLHPLVSLITMFLGLGLFGVIGMLLFPIALSFISTYIKKYKKVEEQ